MIRILTVGAAALALAACSTREDGNAAEANAAANLLETLPNELADDQVSDANLANAAEPPPAAAPAPAETRPAAQPAPRAEPRRPSAPKAEVPTKARTEPDPHAGHDVDNVSND